jgi:FemAB-related protein (PEP-CTERM system-associated)
VAEGIEWTVAGVLPLVLVKHFLLGTSLTSIPFFDMAGILADGPEAEKALLDEALRIAAETGAGILELRQQAALSGISQKDTGHPTNDQAFRSFLNSSKSRMILDLPESAEKLMASFKSKLRSQVKRPLKEGLVCKSGGMELLRDFYSVFLVNMRDLGSPVHSQRIIGEVLRRLPGSSRIFVVYKGGRPIAASLLVSFNRGCFNPWASSLREFSSFSPNMLLYWSMLEYACDAKAATFDFGRSTLGEGTYRFKEQWGARPAPLHWYTFQPNGAGRSGRRMEKDKMGRAVELWKKLPVPVTRILGPAIRKYITL